MIAIQLLALQTMVICDRLKVEHRLIRYSIHQSVSLSPFSAKTLLPFLLLGDLRFNGLFQHIF